jgi:hypothetical protein
MCVQGTDVGADITCCLRSHHGMPNLIQELGMLCTREQGRVTPKSIGLPESRVGAGKGTTAHRAHWVPSPAAGPRNVSVRCVWHGHWDVLSQPVFQLLQAEPVSAEQTPSQSMVNKGQTTQSTFLGILGTIKLMSCEQAICLSSNLMSNSST